MKTAIITGITGQDGAYLAELLLKKNYKVIGITRNNHVSNLEKLAYLGIGDKVKMVECDMMDMSSVINIINTFRPDEVYNLAAQSSVGLSFNQPIGTIQYNIISVLNLLEALRLIKNDTRFYQASSSEMYGTVKSLPVTTDTPMHPLSPYAISKASAYWTVVNYRESYGLYACNGVLFNHESFLRSESFFVKKVVGEAVKNRNNPDWILKVGNIDVKRDFGYSPKYVEAMWLMLQQDHPKDFMICSGKSYLLRDLIDHVFKQLNIPAEKLIVSQELYRPTDILDIYGDNSSAISALGWNYDYNFYDVLDILISEELKANEKINKG
ncbi:GDP-mannose 4,6-dehydratase [Chitinophaga sp. LS1]|uniref:GDP-mannose 4,6-dehydratase n=1 Tax=Chitinophaga sp. LS1 TaxID=3051176 RepID=UPI002AAC3D11|nr:GDP-mannose 4,6-dehydratase [Chitinophaga sp. LS1]WPV68983.1 GDP-mannose 4,6-dehydratase [Chitinophaga sp. LS1]